MLSIPQSEEDQTNGRQEKMKKVTFVPWKYICELAYNEWDCTVISFPDWLAGVNTPVIVLPRAEDDHSRFDLVMASGTIKEKARARGLIVLTEERLRRHIVRRESKPVFVPPSPFATIGFASNGQLVARR